MRKFYLVAIYLFFSIQIFAQIPQKINYQAVFRDSDGNPRANESVELKISVLQGSTTGTEVCYESFSVTTNSFGLINIQIGSVNTTDFSSIDWANGPFFIKIQVDGVEYGTSQILSVPYALYSAKAGNVFSGNYNDLTNSPDLGIYVETSSTVNWDKNAGDDFDGDYNNLLQLPNWSDSINKYQPDLSLYLETSTTEIWDKDSTDDFDGEYLSLLNRPSIVDSINTVLDTTTQFVRFEQDGDATNEIQTISRTGLNVTLSNGGGTFTDSVLSETDVDNFVANNGYATKNMNNENITNLAEPINDQDAVTKEYVDSIATRVDMLLTLLKNTGTSASDMLDAGFTMQELLDKGYTVMDLLNAGKVASDFYGLEYEGGLIAYVNETNGTGLVAAPHNQGRTKWDICTQNYCMDGTRTHASWKAVGYGKFNTDSIVKYISSPDIAAYLCDTLTLNGYDDWALPTNYEMYYVIKNLYENGYGDFPDISIWVNREYWTSTEQDGGYAYYYNIYFSPSGYSTSSMIESASANVRAVRIF